MNENNQTYTTGDVQYTYKLALILINTAHYAKIQKYEQGKIGLQFFDMWC